MMIHSRVIQENLEYPPSSPSPSPLDIMVDNEEDDTSNDFPPLDIMVNSEEDDIFNDEPPDLVLEVWKSLDTVLLHYL